MTLTRDHFDRLYACNDDPWAFRSRWYEERKRAVTMAALPRKRFRRAFEPGCSIGELSAMIASRCDCLLACDTSARATAIARDRMSQQPHVRVETRTMPAQWPREPFDLVIFSELGYYLDSRDLALMAERAIRSLDPDGVLLACHWRPSVDEHLHTGDAVHRYLNKILPFPRLVRHEEADFLLEVWSRDPCSVARAEGVR